MLLYTSTRWYRLRDSLGLVCRPLIVSSSCFSSHVVVRQSVWLLAVVPQLCCQSEHGLCSSVPSTHSPAVANSSFKARRLRFCSRNAVRYLVHASCSPSFSYNACIFARYCAGCLVVLTTTQCNQSFGRLPIQLDGLMRSQSLRQPWRLRGQCCRIRSTHSPYCRCSRSCPSSPSLSAVAGLGRCRLLPGQSG